MPNITPTIPTTKTAGQALVALLEKYGVDTVFGIPGAHTLELYRGLNGSGVRHVLARNEAGAGFMADGYARMSGKPGVCFLITGPGITNATTPIGQAYTDSIPMLVISSENERETLGKRWGELHETTDQSAITRPLTAFSVTVDSAEKLPHYIAEAFTIFNSKRPRPVHISIPIDLMVEPVSEEWQPITPPPLPAPAAVDIARAAELLASATQPTIVLGNGAQGCGAALAELAEILQAAIVCTNAAKGIVPDSHPLSLGATISRQPTLDHINAADVVLAVGSELSYGDHWRDRLPISGKLIRIDIDPIQLFDDERYPVEIGLLADAQQTCGPLLEAVKAASADAARANLHELAAIVKTTSLATASPLESLHIAVLDAIRSALPAQSALFGDMTQIVYTGAFSYASDVPKGWHYAGGFCTLGCAMPMAIGAKVARPELPVAALAGDGGFMFTVQELMAAVEEKLPMALIVWNNSCLGEIKAGMLDGNIEPVGVDSLAPDFVKLAEACGAIGVRPDSWDGLIDAITGAFSAELPTLIELNQDAPFLHA